MPPWFKCHSDIIAKFNSDLSLVSEMTRGQQLDSFSSWMTIYQCICVMHLAPLDPLKSMKSEFEYDHLKL